MILDDGNKIYKKNIYQYKEEEPVILAKSNGNVYISSMFGILCGVCGNDEGPVRARGMMLLDTSIGRFEADELILIKSSFDTSSARIIWQVANGSLEIESHWDFCDKTGVIKQKNILKNTSKTNVVIFGCMSRFVFSPASYEFYSQGGRWCHESQGVWQNLHHGSVVLGCEGGRTSQGSTPYICIREKGQKNGVAFNILPCGNWSIRINAHLSEGDSLPFAVIETGLGDRDLKFEIEPEQSIELPELLIHAVPEGEVQLGAPRLHRYLIDKSEYGAAKVAPATYNTWFDRFDNLDTERLGKQLAAAKKIGCEVFTVDAGWFGGETGNWYLQAGDWREKQDAAFHGQMSDFADEVRAAGLGFGLWMEPERISKLSPIFKEHPEWFISIFNGFNYPDLSKPEVYAYIFGEISRIIEKYKLVWIKIDFNTEFGVDPTGTEFYMYYNSWYSILDELKKKYPEVFFEGCSSGGMRLNSNDLEHCDGYFISDNVNPKDVLRILQGTLLRLPPGKLIKWVILRSLQETIPIYDVLEQNTPKSIITPVKATWDNFEKVDIDFAALVAMMGMFSLGGDISSLAEPELEKLSKHIEFYKKWRMFMLNSVGHLLTPIYNINENRGWVAFQLQGINERTSLLFAFRLDDASNTKVFYLRELDNLCKYNVQCDNNTDFQPEILYGKQLTNEGIHVKIPKRYNAVIVVIAKQT